MKNKNGFYRWLKKRVKKKFKKFRELHKLEIENPTVTLDDDVHIVSCERLFLGKNIYIARDTVINCGNEKWCDYRGRVTIGDNVYISPGVMFYGAGEIEIQQGAKIGRGALITSYAPDVSKLKNDAALFDDPIMPHEFKKVTIGGNVIVGPHCIIQMGVTIGHGSIISAGSIVRHDVPPDSFVFQDNRLKKRSYIKKK